MKFNRLSAWYKRISFNAGVFQEFFKFCRERKKTVQIISAALILLFALQLFRGVVNGKMYVTDKHGKVISVERKSEKKIVSVPLKVFAEKDGILFKEDILLSFKGAATEKNGAGKGEKENKELSVLKQCVSRTVRELEESEEQVVLLPKQLENGTRLIWKKQENYKPFMILLLMPFILFFLYRNEKEKKEKEKEIKLQSVKQELPAFNNQMLLLLHSGMIFSDAFCEVAKGYMKKEKSGYFGEIISSIYDKSRLSEKSIATLLSECAKTVGIREFSRFASVVMDNQCKGVNLTEKLEEESALLWEQRKKLAEEKGRIAETKLSFPLAILLLVLILITASPAVLQI